MDEKESSRNKEGMTRSIGVELLGVIFASILVTLLTTLINFLEAIIRVEEQTNTNTQLIKEIQQDLKQLREEPREQ